MRGGRVVSELCSFDTGDGRVHVMGAGDAPTVLRVLRERAAWDGVAGPEQVSEGELDRGWFRQLEACPEGDDARFVRCSSRDPRAVLMTSYTPQAR